MIQLILIGYRGTGKTTIARRLGERLGIPSMDSDPEIERRAGKSIAEIFSQDGETVFRDWEESTITSILEQNQPNSFVLATGGGAILRQTTRQRLRNAGHVIWLTAKPETILWRIQGDAASATMRPNLTAMPPLEEIVALLEKRNPLYSETAHEIIATDLQDTESIADAILKTRYS